jgi:trehalose/maltose hydrolase-like predicted phosphorylase
MWLSQRPHAATFDQQRYDFSNGELTSRFHFTANGVTAHVEVLTFCSRSLPTLVLQETRIAVDAACSLLIKVGVDPEGIRGEMTTRDAATYNGREVVDGSLRWDGPARLASVGAAFVSQCLHPDAKRQRGEWGYRNAVATEYSINAQPGQSYTVRQITSLVPSVMHSEPDRQAIRMAWLGNSRGFEQLREENRAAWAELWRGRVHLLGAETRWQITLMPRFSICTHRCIRHRRAARVVRAGILAQLSSFSRTRLLGHRNVVAAAVAVDRSARRARHSRLSQ